MYGTFDISTSGLVAQRIRLDTIAGNLANLNTILNAEGEYEPFKRRFAILAAGDPSSGDPMGVRVQSIEMDEGELRLKYEPDSPYADADGYVGYPDIDAVIEQMNAMEATRSYEANITAIEASKMMFNSALQILT
ncbi:MAG: flagellar basal body rod protein FlgC [Planctomycetota bacterium]|nr:flagellar basal body rod protein FlgC [Planctomycetota bacterium]